MREEKYITPALILQPNRVTRRSCCSAMRFLECFVLLLNGSRHVGLQHFQQGVALLEADYVDN